ACRRITSFTTNSAGPIAPASEWYGRKCLRDLKVVLRVARGDRSRAVAEPCHLNQRDVGGVKSKFNRVVTERGDDASTLRPISRRCATGRLQTRLRRVAGECGFLRAECRILRAECAQRVAFAPVEARGGASHQQLVMRVWLCRWSAP